ncbi:ThuA domain-containing protein [Maribacter sp. X9]|uniref:ThuA domain-containing protein n=1 Tax=Maribacter sp. X9 TaxID=3402159 RepID=UPI003AF3BEF3
MILLCAVLTFNCSKKKDTLLVFSKTAGFRHGSIEAGVTALKKLGNENGYQVIATEDANYFVEDSLKNYSTVIFNNTTRDVLNDVQQADFERYIQAGGGFVGIHAATDTEYDWPWYNKLVGAVFNDHPRVQEAKLNITDLSHESTKGLDSVWMKSDEWYNFRNINPDIKVLISIDETSYEGGTNPEGHPISWFHEYDGGKAFYTEMGHTDETFENPTFLNHLLGGIKYAIGDGSLDYSLASTDRVPPEDRFVKKVLDFNLNEPMELDELPGKGILFIERRGALKLYDFDTEKTETLAQLDLFYGNEDGLLGLAVDPDYNTNNWIYLLYSAAGEESKQLISRFTLADGKFDKYSEKIILEVPTDRQCCHSGGALEFGPDRNLYIALGDNTNPFESSGFSPMDEGEGRASWDAQRSAANTNNLRGKISRIKVEDDGTYSIPDGNLFPVGTPNTRPEIYVMGTRNPFRPSIDSKTGYLYWGDIGPDAGKADPNRGPSGMGEYDQARKAGNWGWPYTRGYNEVYNDFDFVTNTSGPKFDPSNLINDSPNNTGMKKLPEAQKSMIPMTYYRSEEFPWMGEGGINPMAGPVYHASDRPNTENPWPSYFENKLFLYEWMRDWIYVITLDENQDYVKADAFMPNTEFSHPMDMIFASNGNMYLLEYGQKWNSQNLDARLSQVSYVKGNREPIAKIENDKTVGAAPLTVQFSAEKSIDFDHDELTYNWFFTGDESQSQEMSPSFTFNEDGIYNVKLKVTDSNGNASITDTKIMVGNDAPTLSIQIPENDSIYWYGKQIDYKIIVTDKQDGSSVDNSIAADDVKVTFDYIPEGKDFVKATLGHQRNLEPEGKKLIESSDCKACHAVAEKVNGPSYTYIAKRYATEDTGYLVSKIIKGGSGTWGERAMSAHPQLSVDVVTQMVEYILTLKPQKNDTKKSLPLEGTLTFDEHKSSGGEGKYVLMASYRDKGNANQPNSQLTVSQQVVFKSQKIEAENASEIKEGTGIWSTSSSKVVGVLQNGSYLKFNDIALDHLKSLKIAMFYNQDQEFKGTLEIHEDSIDGSILGKKALAHNGKEETVYYTIPISTNKEKTDLFLVFKNPANKLQNIGHADWLSFEYQH